MKPLFNTLSMEPTFSSQTLHPLSLLAQVSSRQATGCLKVTTASCEWLLFLEQGRLNYVTNSQRPFDRLDAHLKRLSRQVPTLVSAVRVQIRLLFEQGKTDDTVAADYQAICWLVEQHHLHPNQAANLVEALSSEVLEMFLEVCQGSYELIEADLLKNTPRYCQLNLRSTVETCYARLQQKRARGHQSNGRFHRSPQDPSQAPSSLTSSVSMNAGKGTGQPVSQPRSKSHYTIACIDDSPTVLRAINEFLDEKIFSVLMIDDPVKALMQIIRNKPDLILLDVTMPNLDGYELCSLLRRHPQFKDTPIIMVTSNTGFIDRAKAKLVRASGYLTKPFGQSDLLKMIFKYLN